MDRISILQKEIDELRKTLYMKEDEMYALKRTWNSAAEDRCNMVNQPYTATQNYQYEFSSVSNHKEDSSNAVRLPKWAIERYSRQIILPDIGVEGQKKLCAARVLVVGAGGLGCPAAAYLAGAGVGEIGIVDYDTVEVTNLHRQILHGECDQNMNKVESAANALRRINSNITVTPYNVQLQSSNALELLSRYHIVLDCTDNVPTRYLLNDACVMLKIPLVSGSALKMEGQLTVYGYRGETNGNEKDGGGGVCGPCYRCVFPSPPPPSAVGSCSANGVAGPVCGAVGCLQALQALKWVVGGRRGLLAGRLLLIDGEDCTFRTVKLRPRNPDCASCSDHPTVTRLLDYETFCRTKAIEKDLDLTILRPENRITPLQLAEKLKFVDGAGIRKQRHLLVDVRSEPEFSMCSIDGAVNCPVDNMADDVKFNELLKSLDGYDEASFICRRGNDSQLVVQRAIGRATCAVNDVIGGLQGWAKHVDEDFPIY